jgi:hypothetical protein
MPCAVMGYAVYREGNMKMLKAGLNMLLDVTLLQQILQGIEESEEGNYDDALSLLLALMIKIRLHTQKWKRCCARRNGLTT